MPAINGDTPLHFALFTGWAEGAVLLINRLKSDNQFENTVNGTGNSLLHLAAGKCPVGVVQLLVGSLEESGASEQINSQTDRGSTPLHSNVRTGKPDVGDWLLKNGGEKSILLRDEGERRPCDHLEKRLEKMKEALEELRQKSTGSDQENLRMDKQSQETLAWEKILPKLDPRGQQEAAAGLSDMNALV